MPVFEYRGLSDKGKNVNGLLEADSPKTLRAALRKNGVYLTQVLGTAEQKGKATGAAATTLQQAGSREVNFKFLAGRISTEDIAIATRQLATLLGAGVTLVEALSALVDQIEKESLKRIISELKQKVNEGSSLADAMQAHEKTFGVLYVNMVRAGEHSGALEAVLSRLADFTESQARLTQKFVGTMIYPLIMAVVGGGILTLMMTVVVPKVAKIFESVKATLPWTTRALIFACDLLQDWWYIFFPAVGAGIYLFARWARSPEGQPVVDRYVLKAPIFGPLVRLMAIARFSRTLATLLKAGVPLLTAMDIVKNVVTNSVLRNVVENARDSIREGESIAAPLKRSGEFPPLVYHMVAVGERSGQLEDMLINVAAAYETQVDVKIGALTSLLEPIMMVGMGVVIAFVAFSILMPILQLNTSIH